MLISEAIKEQWGEAELTINCKEDCEGWFSRMPCEGCGSPLSGDRHPAVAWTEPNHSVRSQALLVICVDCLDYLANGNDREVDIA